MTDLPRKLLAEALGTALLVATGIGSGIMATRLTDDTALALLCCSLATGAMLVVLISIFSRVSGAHLNPAVSIVLLGYSNRVALVGYIAAQIIGGLGGAVLAHLMFELPPIQIATTARSGAGLWLAEGVATFGLIGTVLAAIRFRPQAVAWLVGLYIMAAYWFTASTSFANPVVALSRTISDTFAGIRPQDAPAFILAQLAGALLAWLLFTWLLAPFTQKDAE